MRPTFYVHAYPDALPGAPWGWVTRDPDPGGEKVALWVGMPPAPGCAPGARGQAYIKGPSINGLPLLDYRIVDASGRRVLDHIATAPTAQALLAWLCPGSPGVTP